MNNPPVDGFSVHVDGLKPGEVMQSMRRMVLKIYLCLWLGVYVIMALVMLFTKSVTVFTLFGPAIILLLLVGAYEYSGRKNYPSMGYETAVLEYEFNTEGYRLQVGDSTASFPWTTAWIVETRSDLLIYSDKKNCSVLPKRFLQEGQKELLLKWTKK